MLLSASKRPDVDRIVRCHASVAGVAGSSAVIATPAANSLVRAVSSDFDVPAAGFYALNIGHGNMAANSSVSARVALTVHHV